MVTRVQLPLTEKNSSDQFASFDIVSSRCASDFNREEFLEFFFFFFKAENTGKHCVSEEKNQGRVTECDQD